MNNSIFKWQIFKNWVVGSYNYTLFHRVQLFQNLYKFFGVIGVKICCWFITGLQFLVYLLKLLLSLFSVFHHQEQVCLGYLAFRLWWGLLFGLNFHSTFHSNLLGKILLSRKVPGFGLYSKGGPLSGSSSLGVPEFLPY